MTLENEEWLFAREAVALISHLFEHEGQAEAALLRRLSVGTLLAWETGAARFWWEKDWATDIEIELGDGPLPKDFWNKLILSISNSNYKNNGILSNQSWETGDFSFTWPAGSDCTYIGYAHGVLFHRQGIADILGETRIPSRRNSKIIITPTPSFNDIDPPVAPILARRGRSQTYDWAGALAHIAALAHSRDGLFPEGGGEPSASHIARLMETWFIGKDQKAPADSQLRDYASKVIIEINSLKMQDAENSERAA
ncbi:MAG: hypothetical protein IT550_10260 [Novosphingobium sp.]|nr:hypothetical protein [Novosphingobium sp.]